MDWKPKHLDCYKVEPLETGRVSAVSPLGGAYVAIASYGPRTEGEVFGTFDTPKEAWAKFADVFSRYAYAARVAMFRAMPVLENINGKYCVHCRVAFH